MNTNKLKRSVIAAVFLTSPIAFASIEDVALGLGSQTQFVGKVQTDEIGSTNKFEFNPYLSAAMELSITDNLSFFPELGLLIPDNTRDSIISKMTYFMLAMAGYEIGDWVLRAGGGLQMTRISADGGVQVLDNGNGQTSFPMPEESATSRNVITNMGVEYFLHKNISARIEGTIYNPFNKRNRAFGHQLSFHFHFLDLLGLNKKKKSNKVQPAEDQW